MNNNPFFFFFHRRVVGSITPRAREESHANQQGNKSCRRRITYTPNCDSEVEMRDTPAVTPRKDGAVRVAASRAFNALPKSDNFKCAVVDKMCKRLLRSKATASRFKTFLPELSRLGGYGAQFPVTANSCVSPRKVPKVQKLVRKLSIARSKKKWKRVVRTVSEIKQVTSLRNASAVANITWGNFHWMCKVPQSNDDRSVSRIDKENIVKFLSHTNITQQLPFKRYKNVSFMRIALSCAYHQYDLQQAAAGNRVLSFSAFHKHLPKWLRLMAKTPYRHCQCSICVNFCLLIDGIHGAGLAGLPKRLTEVILHTLCVSRTSFEGVTLSDCDRVCIFRECRRCRRGKLSHHILKSNPEVDLQRPVRWHQWCWRRNEGGDKMDYDRHHITGKVSELIILFESQALRMSHHLFHFQWQGEMYERRKIGMEVGELMVVMDFAQNMEHKRAVEPQSAHWQHHTTTMHPTICNYPCEFCSDHALVRQELMMLTDDKTHDALAVYAFENVMLKYFEETGVTVKRLFRFTDNCAAQYKCFTAFDLLSRRQFPVEYVNFGARHAKNDADGYVGRIKDLVEEHNRNELSDIGDTESMYSYCSTVFATTKLGPCGHVHYSRRFFLVTDIDRSFQSDFVTLPGSQSLHCVRNTGQVGVLDTRVSSCSCRPCVSGEGDCEEAGNVDQFQRQSIDPNRSESLNFVSTLWNDDKVCKSNPKKPRPATGTMPDPERESRSSTGKSRGSRHKDRESHSHRERSTDTLPGDERESRRPREKSRSQSQKSSPWPSPAKGVRESSPAVSSEASEHKKKKKKEKHKEKHKSRDSDLTVVKTAPVEIQALTAEEEAAVDARSATFPGFSAAYQKVADCKQFSELHAAVTGWVMPPLPTRIHPDALKWDLKDDNAVDHMPKAAFPSEKWQPVKTSADGNCLPHGLSRLQFGHEGRHMEMRLRLTVELTQNWRSYLDNKKLCAGGKGVEDDVSLFYAQNSSSYVPNMDLKGKNVVKTVFAREVMNTRLTGINCGLWHLHAAANMMGRPVQSVFPNVAQFTIPRQYVHRLMMPDNVSGVNRETARLLWTVVNSDSHHFQHIVPVVK